MRLLDRVRALSIACAVLCAGGAIAAGPASATPAPTSTYRSVCAAHTAPGFAHCDSYVRTDITPRRTLDPLITNGYGPSNLQSAYNLAAAAASGGSGATVAIVDAYNDPTAAADLAVYRAQYGLRACTVSGGCLRVVGQTGSGTVLPPNAPISDDWALEESLDLDMVSAICPNCNILLVEANSEAYADLGTAVNEAVALGARYVSNSYGGGDSSGDSSLDAYYNHPGVVITASSGDNGYGVEYPAASPYVTAVGGTSLTTAGTARGWSETAWSGAGSGCSGFESKPAWQTDAGCARRSVADVSAVADPNTGVNVYDTDNGRAGWQIIGGTSASSPIIASVYALAGTPAAGSNPAQYPYQHTGSLYDVVSGSNGSCGTYLCNGVSGYDGPTGLGTPNGVTAFGSGTAAPGGPVTAFQSSAGGLWTYASSGAVNLSQAMAAGTNPSITALPGGGYEEAFQSNLGHLVEIGSAVNLDTQLAMAPGTSPSIAAQTDGTFKVSYQGSNGHLMKHSIQTGAVDTGLLMAAGTSPSITPISTGNYETAFQQNTGSLYVTGVTNLDTQVALAPGTSPSIAGQSDGTFKVALQSSAGHLCKYSLQTGLADTGLAAMPGTSPSISPITTGNYETAFQSSTGTMYLTGVINLDTQITMATGTAPAIAGLADGTFRVAFQANTGRLWQFSMQALGSDTGIAMKPGTGPAIAR